MIETHGTETKKAQTDVQKGFEFVAGVIESSRDTFNLQCSQKLLQFFKETYYEKHGGQKAYDQLQSLIVAKIQTISLS